ncbi:maleylpyruvate isomerase family mycothiol-dependent enzyme [Streptomyces paludis]|uniref:Maleylpyruvate isomerase family mycothiol-dependent enzyme n=1 Tax=Streptomyces paludis TaxID=2282738 RepID=A0A345HPY3_9ACTN|nr:maleylpyruvate isomerase family mycothiol-dependent enzyme [Streptomyces paludis]AXG78757.1 maleylpyruvate isomerase family mycothiol-dependent enzyme [Streptomyces paludis]
MSPATNPASTPATNPARKPAAKRPRPRAYDYAKTRAAVLAQVRHVQDAVQTLTPAQLALPSGLGEWSVRELVAHVAMGVESVSLFLEQPVRAEAAVVAEAGPVVVLAEWPFVTVRYAGAIAEDVTALAVTAPPGELLGRAVERIGALLPAADDGRVLVTRVGAMRLADYLVTRTVELTVHTDDLNRAAGLSIPFDRQALAAATRLLADALAVKAPGASTEVRIPPYAVVQCVEGPRHTRGTPPNVVETDPLTWLRLATGRTAWAEGLDTARVSASGERADLSGLLPLMG